MKTYGNEQEWRARGDRNRGCSRSSPPLLASPLCASRQSKQQRGQFGRISPALGLGTAKGSHATQMRGEKQKPFSSSAWPAAKQAACLTSRLSAEKTFLARCAGTEVRCERREKCGRKKAETSKSDKKWREREKPRMHAKHGGRGCGKAGRVRREGWRGAKTERMREKRQLFPTHPASPSQDVRSNLRIFGSEPERRRRKQRGCEGKVFSRG